MDHFKLENIVYLLGFSGQFTSWREAVQHGIEQRNHEVSAWYGRWMVH